MRVLIVSVTTGYGHHSTSAALAQALRARGAEAVVLDLYQYWGEFPYRAMDKGYLFFAGPLRRLFGKSYRAADRSSRTRRFTTSIVAPSMLSRTFAHAFYGFRPDAVIGVHVYAGYVLNELRRQGELKVPALGIVTDYCIHPYWEDYTSLDYIISASELLNDEARAKGIVPPRLLPFGLPVQPKFLTRTERGEARALLGLADRPTVLLMGGSMGYGKMEATVRELLDGVEEAQLLCVCGKNAELEKSLRKISDPRLRVFGFVNNVDRLMDAADCIVTKPGGLTVTELLVKRLPPVLTEPIPGHEEANAAFLSSHGAALVTGPERSAAQAVSELLRDPDRRARMRCALASLACPDALDRITDFVLGLGEQCAMCN